MCRHLLHAFTAVVLLPGILGLIVYQGFCTNYTVNVFHEAGFRKQYEKGIYKYRVVGRVLLLATDRALQSDHRVARITRGYLGGIPRSVRLLDPKATKSFYAAYVLLNTLALMLCSLVLYAILFTGGGEALSENRFSGSSTHLVGVLLIALTQYVVVPYDNVSYFLLLLCALLIVRPFRFSFPLLLAVLAVSTMTRESSALTLSFYFACHLDKLLKREKQEVRGLLLMVLTFLATYTLLRMQLGWDQAIYQCGQVRVNLTRPYNLAGMALLPVVSYLICLGSPYVRRCVVFFLASTPYLFLLILIAETWETRLWVPIWLSLLVLARPRVPPKNSVRVAT